MRIQFGTNNRHKRTALDPATVLALRWSLGADVELPIRSALPETALQAVAQHGLVFRFLERVRAEKPTCLDRASMAKLLLFSGRRKALADAQLDSLAEIGDVCKRSGLGAPLIIKGLSTYAVTGDRRHLPVSDDIDMFAPCRQDLITELTGVGYLARPKGDGHEEADLVKGPVVVDVHKWFASWKYPDGLRERFGRGPTYLRRMRAGDIRWANQHVITYYELADKCIPGRIPAAADILVPAPTLGALLQAIHAFTGYIEPSYWHVRLCDLAQVHDLMEHPEFSQQDYRRLAARYMAEDAVDYVRAVIAHWYDPATDGSQVFRFPVRVTYEGGWASPFTLDELATPRSDRKMVARIGGEQATAVKQGESALVPYSTIEGAGATTIRSLTHALASRDATPIDIRFCCTWTETATLFEVCICTPLPDGDYYYRVRPATDDGRTVVATDLGPDRWSEASGGTWNSLPGYPWHVAIDWDWRQADEHPLILHVSLRYGKLAGVKTTIIPLRIVRQTADSHDSASKKARNGQVEGRH